MPICSKCKIEKEKSDFNKHSLTKTGLRSQCRECVSTDRKKYRENNKYKIKESAKKYYEINKDKVGENNKKYR